MAAGSNTTGRRLLLGFGVISLASVAAGAAICAFSGVPAGLWIRNLAAWAVGAGLAATIAALARPALLHVFLWAAPVGLAATFLSAPQDGVHRWIDAGPLHINAAMVLTPLSVVALAALAKSRPWAWLAPAAALGLLIAQPDASQATSLALAAAAAVPLTFRRTAVRLPILLLGTLAVVWAWLRPDPLQPVPEVEGVIALAFRLSPIAAITACLLLFAVALPSALLTVAGPSTTRPAALALSLCLLGWMLTPLFGAFPVPLVGIGLSPIIGAWLGIGLLAGVLKLEAPLHGISTSPGSTADTPASA